MLITILKLILISLTNHSIMFKNKYVKLVIDIIKTNKYLEVCANACYVIIALVLAGMCLSLAATTLKVVLFITAFIFFTLVATIAAIGTYIAYKYHETITN